MIWIFDLCGTLVRENTTFAFVDRDSNDHALSRYVRARRQPPLRLFNRLCYAARIDLLRMAAARGQRGRPRAEMLASTQRLINDLHPVAAARQMLDDCIARGDRLILASASFDFIAEPIAHALGIAEVVSSRLEYDEQGICLGCMQQDLLGRKWDVLAELVDGPFNVVTDNLDDDGLVRRAHKAFIVTKPRDIAYWNSFPNVSIIDTEAGS